MLVNISLQFIIEYLCMCVRACMCVCVCVHASATLACWLCLRASLIQQSRESAAATVRIVSPWFAGEIHGPKLFCCGQQVCMQKEWWVSSNLQMPLLQVQDISVLTFLLCFFLVLKLKIGSFIVSEIECWKVTILCIIYRFVFKHCSLQFPPRQIPPVWSRRSTCKPLSVPCHHTARAVAETHSVASLQRIWTPQVCLYHTQYEMDILILSCFYKYVRKIRLKWKNLNPLITIILFFIVILR